MTISKRIITFFWLTSKCFLEAGTKKTPNQNNSNNSIKTRRGGKIWQLHDVSFAEEQMTDYWMNAWATSYYIQAFINSSNSHWIVACARTLTPEHWAANPPPPTCLDKWLYSNYNVWRRFWVYSSAHTKLLIMQFWFCKFLRNCCFYCRKHEIHHLFLEKISIRLSCTHKWRCLWQVL